jgi:hypothetical protein
MQHKMRKMPHTPADVQHTACNRSVKGATVVADFIFDIDAIKARTAFSLR